MKIKVLNVAVGAMMLASVAQALPTFNDVVWNAVMKDLAYYQDPHYEEAGVGDNAFATSQPAKIDIVGNATRPAAYYGYDGQYMYFRMRVDVDPTGGIPSPTLAQINSVWSVVFNTDTDDTADWVLQLDMQTDGQVELVRATAGSPGDLTKPFYELAYEGGPHDGTPTEGVATDWYRFISTGENVFTDPTPGAEDHFVDIAFDKARFDEILGAEAVDSFEMVFATSANHENSNKDLPDNGWSDTVTVPEPTSMALLALGVTVLAMRRRKI